MASKHLLEDFNPVSKEEWMVAIEKHLKGKKADSLDWNLTDTLTISPTVRASDTTSHSLGTIDLSAANEWYITEKIIVQDNNYQQANQLALEALQKGANGLCFVLNSLPSSSNLEELWKDIILELIPIHLEGTVIETNAAALLEQILAVKGSSKWRGSWSGNSFSQDQLLWYLQQSTDFLSFQPITIQIKEHNADELAQALHQASLWIDFLLQNDIDERQIVDLFRFELETNELYFINIAIFRAFRRLWLGILEAYRIEEATYPFVHASTTLSKEKDSPHWNMITATTQAMSAVIGGVDSLAVCPGEGWDTTDHFSRRIARNVQHLLVSESYLDRVTDPAAGAYYIEQITDKLTTEAWQKFCSY